MRLRRVLRAIRTIVMWFFFGPPESRLGRRGR
jgi:hypothetical protein